MTQLEPKFNFKERVLFPQSPGVQTEGTVVGIQGHLQPTEKVSVLYLIMVREDGKSSEHVVPEGDIIPIKEECRV